MVETVKQLSINDVVEGGVKLSLLLNAVGCEFSSPEIDIHSISKVISLFALGLKQIGRGFQAADSLHSGDALSTARKIAVQGRVIFDEIEKMLDQARGTGGYSISADSSLNQRFSQSFKPHRVTYLLAHLETLQLSLMVMSLVFQTGSSMAVQRYSDKNQKRPTNDTIQQERVDAQNMVVIWHWSVNRLNRLYSLSKHEIYLSSSDENATASRRPENPTPPYQLPVIPLEESRNHPSSMNGSPRDMVRESANVVNRLTFVWVRQDVNRGKTSEEQAASEVRGTDNRNLNGATKPNLQGCYVEGTASGWKTPHSPPPRKSASHTPDRYSKYQPRVDSDSDSSDDRSRQKSRRSEKDPFSTTNDSSGLAGCPGHRHGKPDAQKKTGFEEPVTHVQPYPPGTKDSQGDREVKSPTIPQFQANYSRRPTPTFQQQQNGTGAYHPAPFPAQYQHQHQHSPPLHYERSEKRTPSPSRYRHHDDRSRYDTLYRDERHRRRKRDATKGILGIGALAGFLTALEGLSI